MAEHQPKVKELAAELGAARLQVRAQWRVVMECFCWVLAWRVVCRCAYVFALCGV